jgi:hypothetical protein
MRLVSELCPVERVRRGYVVGVAFDPDHDEFVLAATSRCGQGLQRPLPSWTELCREAPGETRRALLRRGARLTLNQPPHLGPG